MYGALAVGGTVATGIGRVFPEPSVNDGRDGKAGKPVPVPLVVLALEALVVWEEVVEDVSAGKPVFVFVVV